MGSSPLFRLFNYWVFALIGFTVQNVLGFTRPFVTLGVLTDLENHFLCDF